MKVKYIGPISPVVTPDIGSAEIKRGDVLEVDDELGARLIEQPENWAAVAKASPAVSKPDAGA